MNSTILRRVSSVLLAFVLALFCVPALPALAGGAGVDERHAAEGVIHRAVGVGCPHPVAHRLATPEQNPEPAWLVCQ